MSLLSVCPITPCPSLLLCLPCICSHQHPAVDLIRDVAKERELRVWDQVEFSICEMSSSLPGYSEHNDRPKARLGRKIQVWSRNDGSAYLQLPELQETLSVLCSGNCTSREFGCSVDEHPWALDVLGAPLCWDALSGSAGILAPQCRFCTPSSQVHRAESFWKQPHFGPLFTALSKRFLLFLLCPQVHSTWWCSQMGKKWQEICRNVTDSKSYTDSSRAGYRFHSISYVKTWLNCFQIHPASGMPKCPRQGLCCTGSLCWGGREGS